MGDECGQAVVVAEPDLRRRDGVVLVHDRDDAELEQLRERTVRVAVVAAPGHIIDGQQYLAHDVPMTGEPFGVMRHEQALAYSRGRLLCREVTRSLPQPDRRYPGRDRPGADQDHLIAA